MRRPLFFLRMLPHSAQSLARARAEVKANPRPHGQEGWAFQCDVHDARTLFSRTRRGSFQSLDALRINVCSSVSCLPRRYPLSSVMSAYFPTSPLRLFSPEAWSTPLVQEVGTYAFPGSRAPYVRDTDMLVYIKALAKRRKPRLRAGDV